MFSFIPDYLFQYIYLFIVTIATVSVCSKYKQTLDNAYVEHRRNSSAGFLALFMILFIGLRPQSGAFVDMMNYKNHYYALFYGRAFHFDFETDNLLFDNLFHWLGSMQVDITYFFLFIAAIYFGTSYLGIKRLFPNDTLAAYLVFLAAFSTFSFGTNGIKAGSAASLFILALSYRDKLKVCIPLVLLSWGFHHSMQLPVVAFVLTIFFKNPKWYYYAWVLCFIMAALRIKFFQNLFGGMTDDHGAAYLVGGTGETVSNKILGGFRIDFIIYSAMPIIIGYVIEIKRKYQVSDFYLSLIHLYICINGVWMLCMYAEFTNRIAYLSWMLYPVVLIYPFLKEQIWEDRYFKFANVMGYHLAFTLFMDLVFYGGLVKLIIKL